MDEIWEVFKHLFLNFNIFIFNFAIMKIICDPCHPLVLFWCTMKEMRACPAQRDFPRFPHGGHPVPFDGVHNGPQ